VTESRALSEARARARALQEDLGVLVLRTDGDVAVVPLASWEERQSGRS